MKWLASRNVDTGSPVTAVNVDSDAPAGQKIEAESPYVIQHALAARLQERIEREVRGKTEVVRCFLAALLAGGSVLLEDLPGTGKTTLAKTFAGLVNLDFKRIQCTPDLLPSDVCGFSMYNPREASFDFRAGPIFCNVLLVDEINRASPRTQSALLESMAEQQVTIEGVRHELPSPFMVIATQNPAGFQGTYPLPEAQLDRFIFHLSLEYPDFDSEIELLYLQDQEETNADPIALEEFLQVQQQVTKVTVKREVAEYMVRLISATRDSPRTELGASPRGSQMLFRAAQAEALLSGRDYVTPDDVQFVAPLVLAHRIVPKRGELPADLTKHQDKRPLVEELMAEIAVPA